MDASSIPPHQSYKLVIHLRVGEVGTAAILGGRKTAGLRLQWTESLPIELVCGPHLPLEARHIHACFLSSLPGRLFQPLLELPQMIAAVGLPRPRLRHLHLFARICVLLRGDGPFLKGCWSLRGLWQLPSPTERSLRRGPLRWSHPLKLLDH